MLVSFFWNVGAIKRYTSRHLKKNSRQELELS